MKVQAKSLNALLHSFAFDLVNKNGLVCSNFRHKNRNLKKRPLLKTSELSKNAIILAISIHLCLRHAFCQNILVLTNRVIEP